MSIERAIHERWESYGALTDLVPSTKMRTGWMPPADTKFAQLSLPFVSLIRVGDPTVQTPSGSVVTFVNLRFAVWSDDLGQAKQIARTIERRFDDANYSYIGGKVIRMRRFGSVEQQMADGTWSCAVSYETITQEP